MAKVGESVKYVEAWDDFDLEVKKGSSIKNSQLNGRSVIQVLSRLQKEKQPERTLSFMRKRQEQYG